MADEVLSVGAVARRLGVAVTTLRTWHQRYGLGPSEHLPGHHRRYTAADLARLEIMRRLTAEGVSPAEAARWARRAGEPYSAESARPRRRAGARGTSRTGEPTIPLGRATPAAHALARAAGRLDQDGMGTAIGRAIGTDGVLTTWDRLLRPVLVGIGSRHAETGGLIEVEHLLSRCVSEAFAAVPRPRTGPARILLACADEEQHSLPLEALAAALAEVGVPCRSLGARVPVAALRTAVDRTTPAVVTVWSHARVTADPAQLVAVLTSPHRPVLVLAAGPGWDPAALPAGVIRPQTLGEAVSLSVAVFQSVDRSPGRPAAG
ncbi:MerR family transcriptional regulator [Plantactinospora sp. GCM10030261]|uniref:MerR family transcriptional regulator n=1 Tax=Plantactinospora sp. GCM10030261 TaxID=3273420 RepID=UPI003620E62D